MDRTKTYKSVDATRYNLRRSDYNIPVTKKITYDKMLEKRGTKPKHVSVSPYPYGREFGLGGLIGGGIGAIGGAFLGNPMLGASIGSSIGGGIESSIGSRRAQRRDRRRMRDMELANRTIMSGSLGMQEFAYGGQLDPPMTGKIGVPSNGMGGYPKSIGKSSYAFEGRKHADGGIALGKNEVEGGETIASLPKGEYVFSDRLKVPGTKKTFAQRHKELEDMGAPRTAFKTLERMQEKMNGGEMRSKMMYGGKKMPFGGYDDPPYKEPLDPNPFGPKTLFGDGFGSAISNIGNMSLPEIRVTAKREPSLINLQTPRLNINNTLEPLNIPNPTRSGIANNPVQEAAPKNLLNSKTASLVGQFLPDAINVATGLFGKDRTRPATKVNRSSLANFNTKFNINPALRRNDESYASILADRNTTQSQRLAALSQKLTSDSALAVEKENMENRLKSDKARLGVALDVRQAGFDEQFRQDKMASEANFGIDGNFVRSAVGNISNKLLQMQRDKNLANRDNAYLEILKKIYG